MKKERYKSTMKNNKYNKLKRCEDEILFSIVIPVYKAEKYIIRCLESVRKQIYQNYEIILVNDGSPDRSEMLVAQYMKQHPELNFKYIKQENKGAAIARGVGVENAKGEYIAFLDADDIWYPKKLETDFKYIRDTDGDVFYNDEYVVSNDGKRMACRYGELGDDPFFHLIVYENPISTSTVVVEAERLRRDHTFFDGKRYGEDIACWIGLAQRGAKFIHIKEILGEYIRSETGLTLGSIEYVVGTEKRKLEFVDMLKERGIDEERINDIKRSIKKRGIYNIARFYHLGKQFREAQKYYKNAIKMGNRNAKVYIGLTLAFLHIKR